MIIATKYPDELPEGFLAVFVAKTLLGMALGVYPAFLRWNLPPLYHSGVRWELEPGHGSGKEDFALPLTVYRRKVGDCDDLTIWGCCEAWQQQRLHPEHVLLAVAQDRAARPWVRWEGPEMHALIKLPGGERFEDPSRELGG